MKPLRVVILVVVMLSVSAIIGLVMHGIAWMARWVVDEPVLSWAFTAGCVFSLGQLGLYLWRGDYDSFLAGKDDD